MMNATPPKDGFIEEDGLRLHYVERGKAEEETVVFIHGVRDQCRSWDLLIEAWPPRGASLQHPVALDCAVTETATGPRTAGGYRHEGFLFDLGALFRHLNKQSAILIGHSLGGSTALLYAGCFPDKVKSLVLLESLGPLARADDELPELMAKRLYGRDYVGIHFPYESLAEAAKALQKRFPLIPDGAAAHMALYGTRQAGQSYRWKYDPILRYRMATTLSEGQVQAFLRRVKCPILLVHGTESDFMNRRAVPAPSNFPTPGSSPSKAPAITSRTKSPKSSPRSSLVFCREETEPATGPP